MTAVSTVSIPTENGSKYLQQLCKHWSHKMPVEFTPQQGSVTFPAEGRAGSWPGEAVLSLTAQDDALACRLEASVPEQRDVLKKVVADHLDRFAFKEAPLAFDWQDA